MRKKLLLDLAEFLEKGKFSELGGKFDMGSFGEMRIAPDAEPVAHDGHVCYPCKTTACALGWAPAVPSIAKAGLGRSDIPKLPGEASNPDFTVNGVRINDELEAGALIFSITLDQAEWLFMPNTIDYEDVTAKVEAKRIRRFVAANGNLNKLGET